MGSFFSDKTLWISVCYVLMWYAFSLGMTFFNKWLFEVYNFHFPLVVTTIHMFTITCITGGARAFRATMWGSDRPRLERADWLRKVFPTGVVGALDIGLSNLSLSMIDVTLYTMCKSTVLAFTLIFACLFKLERLTFNLVGVIATISLGVVLFRAKEGVNFESTGFFLVLTASAMGGLRWVLTQTVMHKQCPEIGHPVDSLFHIAPAMGLTMFPFAALLEGRRLAASPMLESSDAVFATLMLVLAGSFMAFGLVMSEFCLVKTTSSVTLSVAGMFKEVCTITIAVLVAGETLSPLNVGGLAVSLVGIAYYNILKYRGLVAAPRHYTPLRNETPEDPEPKIAEHSV